LTAKIIGENYQTFTIPAISSTIVPAPVHHMQSEFIASWEIRLHVFILLFLHRLLQHLHPDLPAMLKLLLLINSSQGKALFLAC
jgi:hypothetical protein